VEGNFRASAQTYLRRINMTSSGWWTVVALRIPAVDLALAQRLAPLGQAAAVTP